jgi:hypothetical protein
MMIGSAALTAALLCSSAAQALTIGQTDAFEDGTTQGWGVPGASPNPPVNVATGGPNGTGDGYLQLVASGAGAGAAGSRLSVLNSGQWAGNYLATGIRTIRMDVNNFGPDDLYLRLLFEDFEGAGPPVNLALTEDSQFVPAGSDWTEVAFSIDLDNLVALLGTALGAVTDTDTLRIFHNPDPAFPGPGVGIPTVNVTLGVDNITAVPEPSAPTLALAVGLSLLAASAVRHRLGARNAPGQVFNR